MPFCSHCGHKLERDHRYCGGCGVPLGTPGALPSGAASLPLNAAPAAGVRRDAPRLGAGAAAGASVLPAGRGFVQTFGLDIRVAMLAVIVDVMAFSADVVSLGLLVPVELGAAALLALITYRIQRAWYGDDHDSALIKALVIGMLTAIPVPITWLVAGPGGALGIVRLLRRR